MIILLGLELIQILLFISTALGNIAPPFTTIQILWANIIADVPPAMSLGVEPHELDIMSRKPRSRTEGVLTLPTSILVLSQALMLSMITFAVYMISRDHGINGPVSLEYQRSLAFMTLTIMQLTQSFYSRSISHSIFTVGLFGNKWLVGAYIFSMVCVVIGTYVPGINGWLGLQDIGGIGWGIIFACLVIQFVFVELIKMVYRRWMYRRLLRARDGGDYTEMAEEVRV